MSCVARRGRPLAGSAPATRADVQCAARDFFEPLVPAFEASDPIAVDDGVPPSASDPDR